MIKGKQLEFFVPVEGQAHNVIVVASYYSTAGMSMFNYKQNPGGFYVSASPANKKDDGGLSFMLGQGKKMLVEPATRLNQKKVAAYLDTAKKHIADKKGEIWLLVQSICNEFNLTLKEAECPVP